MDALEMWINDRRVEERHLSPTTTLLSYLRGPLGLTGTKEGCAEGDCGACTVALLDPDAPGGPRYRAVNSCLVLLPMVQGRRVYTVEALAEAGPLHPAQAAMVDTLGSQCGYCTPGFVMSLFEATYRDDLDAAWKLDDQLCGNLCRCTGYRPIRDAALRIAGTRPADAFSERLASAPGSPVVAYQGSGRRFDTPPDFARLFEVLEEHPGARVVSGGTDLSLEITKAHRHPDHLVSLEALPQLSDLEVRDDLVRVGATVRLTDLEAACTEVLPSVTRMLRFFGSRQIKHRATLGGNVCNASPIGDLPPVLLAHDARLVLRSRAGTRTLPADAFFIDYRKTALNPGEILEAVEIPRPPTGARVASYKVSKRRELDISTVCACFHVRTDDRGVVSFARLAYGGMAATPARARNAEAALEGKTLDGALEAAVNALDQDFAPIDDHRGSAWYRRTVAANLLRGFVDETRARSQPALPDRPTATVAPEAAP